MFFELYFYDDVSICTEWINTNQVTKLMEINRELAVFVQQRWMCGCVPPPSIITSSQFTCHHDAEHVIYRASVSVSAVGVSREELEEWPRTHRSILLQGQKLSVEENCPVIINSLEDEGECQLTSTPVMISLTTFLLTMAAVFIVTLLAAVASTVLIQLFCCTSRYRKK